MNSTSWQASASSRLRNFWAPSIAQRLDAIDEVVEDLLALCRVERKHPVDQREVDAVSRLPRLEAGVPSVFVVAKSTQIEPTGPRGTVHSARRPTPRTLLPADLEPVLDGDLYAAAEYYFDGVWSNVTAGERALMTLMAPRADGWRREELRLPAGESAVEEVLALLKQHDVVVESADGIRFASELMRWWILRREEDED